MDQKRAESLRFWGTLAGAIAAGGFTVGMVAGSFAKADDFQKNAVEVAGRLSAVEATTRNIESDYHSVREQLWRIADMVGAQRVPEPQHETPAPPADRKKP